MKIAYLILAHNTPRHLQALVRSLRLEGNHFFVHIDSKADIELFEPVRAADVSFIEDRKAVFWGDFSQVDAILELLRNGLQHADEFDYFVLLSGSDYPLYSAATIQTFFSEHRGTEFMNIVSMPSEAAGKPLSRLTRYRHAAGTPVFARAARKLLTKLHVLAEERDYKRHFGDLQPYGGSEWWAITRAAAEYTLRYVAEHPEFVQFCKHCHAPDEMFFQTILGNSPFRNQMRRNLVFTDWSAGGANPAPISEAHLVLFETDMRSPEDDVYGPGELLFARKFPNDSDALLQRIDMIRSNR
ncbi:MAG: glycosyl transferase family 14 [Rhodocyclales bacterium]|nr:glycosyl transferase family 14 [Rhodocyclales bacterium]